MYVIRSAVPPPVSATRKGLFIVKQTRAIDGRAVWTLVLLPLLPHDRMLRQLQARKYQIRIRESCVACCVDHSVLGSPHARPAEPARRLRTRLCTCQIAFSGPISTIAVLESSFWRRRKAFAGARVQEIERGEEMWAPSRFLPWTLFTARSCIVYFDLVGSVCLSSRSPSCSKVTGSFVSKIGGFWRTVASTSSPQI